MKIANREQAIQSMNELNNKLLKAADAYYNDEPIMTDNEFDELYDNLLECEKDTGIVLSNSITQKVGFEIKSELNKEKHEEKALSLDKTKDINNLANWLGDKEGFLSWKLDGLTLVVTYNNGKIEKVVTRGNGEIGENVTHNAIHVQGLPKHIPYSHKLVVRGECFMKYSTFNKVNVNGEYKNPRNLASGTIRSLDSNVLLKRPLNFQAFELVSTDNGLPFNSFTKNIDYLSQLGFDVVDGGLVNADVLKQVIPLEETKIVNNDFPSDGLVLQYDDIKYGKSLGVTGKYPKWGMAFKWKDETASTTIKEIIWQTSRTGLINPVVLFEPVELEGTTVQRATANNVSFMKKHHLTVGSQIDVYKANMIIPTIAKNTNPVGELDIPTVCPVCGGVAKITPTKDAEVLMCTNPNCDAKGLKLLSHFCSRDAMNIMGVSDKVLNKLIENGYLDNILDLYKLEDSPEIANLDGMGTRSYEKLIDSIDNSRTVRPSNFLYSLGINNVGKRVSKDIMEYCEQDPTILADMLDDGDDLGEIEGVGDVIIDSITTWWNNDDNRALYFDLLEELEFIVEEKKTDSQVSGKTFCVTGKVYIFDNRKAVERWIEERGGRLATSVSSKTDYLVTNDTTSGSNKNKKAKQLGIPVITEQELLDLDS